MVEDASLRSVSAQPARYAAAPAFTGAGASMLSPARSLLPVGADALARRCAPRAPTGSGSPFHRPGSPARASSAAVGLYGTVRGGQYDDFVALQGDPRDLVARALGFGIEEVDDLRHRRTRPDRSAAGGRRRSTRLAAVLRCRRGARAPAGGAADQGRPRSASSIPTRSRSRSVEREPFALWQNDGEVFVVSRRMARSIDRFDDARFTRLPLVVGEGAHQRRGFRRADGGRAGSESRMSAPACSSASVAGP